MLKVSTLFQVNSCLTVSLSLFSLTTVCCSNWLSLWERGGLCVGGFFSAFFLIFKKKYCVLELNHCCLLMFTMLITTSFLTVIFFRGRRRCSLTENILFIK